MRMGSLTVVTHPSDHLTIGARLVRAGLISAADVVRVLQYQREHRLRFGEAAVRMGLISPADMHHALSSQFDYSYLRASDGPSHISKELLAAHEPFDSSVDQFRAIRSQLMLKWLQQGDHGNVIAVVGAERQEGRSYLAANLAVVFSQAGASTLLIDADLRTPRQCDLFGLDNRIGLSTLLSGRDHEEPIIRIADLNGLFVLPAGPLPPNPLELLSKPALSACLAKVSSSFDLVIIDTPALSVAEDAVLTSVRAGAALAVARSGCTRLPAYSHMVQQLKQSGVALVGSVLNDVGRAGAPA